MRSATTKICLVRHGETNWNAEGRIQGQLDTPLNDVGLAQALAVARALARESFDVIYASDLTRVTQTAEATATRLALPLQLNPALRERHYGIFETLTYDDAKLRHPELFARFKAREMDLDFVSGESLRGFSARAIACYTEILNAHADKQILIFTHGGVLEMIYRHVKRLTLSSARDFELPNAGLNWIEVTDERSSVLVWGDTGHLKGALDELDS